MSEQEFTTGMIWRPISTRSAKRFYRQHWPGSLPRGYRWVYVENVQYAPEDRPSFLVAGECGLWGIVGVKGQGR